MLLQWDLHLASLLLPRMTEEPVLLFFPHYSQLTKCAQKPGEEEEEWIRERESFSHVDAGIDN